MPALLMAITMTTVLGGLYGGYRWLTQSPYFSISRLEIRGNAGLSEQAIAELIAVPKRANIFRTDMDTLEARLLEDPWIARAEVSRDLPSSLEVRVWEHRAAAAVELDGLYLISSEGELFKRATPGSGEVEGLCIITGIEREDVVASPGETQARFAYALEALERYRKNSARPKIGELHLDARHGLSLITFEDAIAIHVGSPTGDEFEDRYQAFDTAYQALSSEEHAAARAFRIADRTPSDRVTVAFAGK